MTYRPRMRHSPLRRTQTGATLLVAIIMLLIITLLAISSLRGVSLESRITGNLKLQKNLTNAAEAGLRMGEKSIDSWRCLSTTNKPCLSATLLTPDSNGDYPVLFNNSTYLSTYINTVDASKYEVRVQWYITDLRYLGAPVQDGCGSAATGCGNHYYEITSCASTVLCSDDAVTQRVILRSVFVVPGV